MCWFCAGGCTWTQLSSKIPDAIGRCECDARKDNHWARAGLCTWNLCVPVSRTTSEDLENSWMGLPLDKQSLSDSSLGLPARVTLLKQLQSSELSGQQDPASIQQTAYQLGIIWRLATRVSRSAWSRAIQVAIVSMKLALRLLNEPLWAISRHSSLSYQPPL